MSVTSNQDLYDIGQEVAPEPTEVPGQTVDMSYSDNVFQVWITIFALVTCNMKYMLMFAE